MVIIKCEKFGSEQASYESNGFFLQREPVLPPDVVTRAADGMDAIRRGEYDMGSPPDPSSWNPGDDPKKLCKIENPQFASHGVMELVRHPALGKFIGRLTGAR